MATATDQAPTTLQIIRAFPAPREKVFRAWTDPQALARWFAPGDEYETSVLELDVRAGGRYRIEMRRQDKIHRVGGTYREVKPPERLVFTWRWEHEPDNGDVGNSVVTIELLDRGGSTELVLTHEKLPSEAARGEHQHGWMGCLDRLGKLLPALA